jgi:hypothetical protein
MIFRSNADDSGSADSGQQLIQARKGRKKSALTIKLANDD